MFHKAILVCFFDESFDQMHGYDRVSSPQQKSKTCRLIRKYERTLIGCPVRSAHFAFLEAFVVLVSQLIKPLTSASNIVLDRMDFNSIQPWNKENIESSLARFVFLLLPVSNDDYILTFYRSVYSCEQFTDMTITCGDGKTLRAHQVILCKAKISL